MTTITRAAGILYRTPDRRALFLKRGPAGDYPGFWCFPGGKIEGDETAEQAAKREFVEEAGSLPKGKIELLSRSITPIGPRGPTADGAANGVLALPPGAAPEANDELVDFSTFSVEGEPFEVEKDLEHVGYAWAPMSDPPQPLHPGCAVAIERLRADELGVARMMAEGRITSPQRYHNVTLWAMRITGTGVAYRRPLLKRDGRGTVVLGDDEKPIVEREEEFPWRDPAIYLNDEFLARCNGLPVIWLHPKGSTLNSKEFERRIVGTIFVPFIKGDEVWGIAKVYDDEANAEIAKDDLSTSPAVVLSDPESPSYKFRLEGGELLLVEGKPSLLDHLAICKQGVWDKGGEPSGIININDSTQDQGGQKVMPEAVKIAPSLEDVLAAIGAIGTRVDAIGGSVTAIGARVDAMEKEDSDEEKAKKDAEEKAEKEKADAEEKEKKDAEEKAEKEKADAALKADGEKGDDKATEVAADAVKKADAACVKVDAVTAENVELRSRLAKMEARLPQDRSDDDHRTMSAAQSRADSVYELYGKQAPRFLSGEGLAAYRRRLVTPFLKDSPAWKAVDVGILADAAFDVAEPQIYADAASAARDAIGVEDGGLRMVQGTTPSGHRKIEFYGRPSSWMNRFGGARRYATSIRPNTSRSAEA